MHKTWCFNGKKYLFIVQYIVYDYVFFEALFIVNL